MSSCSPRLRSSPQRYSSASAARQLWTAASGCATSSAKRSKVADVRVACDVRNPLLGERGAARVFGPQKGADRAAVAELEARLASLAELEPFRDLAGAGAGGGLGAAFAALGGELIPGAELVLDLIGFDAQCGGRRARRHR